MRTTFYRHETNQGLVLSSNHFSSMNRGREYDDDDEDDTDSEDYYSPTDWERESNESDEDYSERMQDLEDWMEAFD